ncbi:endonuclease/exonuclease/phosphatase family protein [Paracoccus xiamenensis]|uniref:endonuclease/exonuclease/phosphatase family protein n=1 Tax=Paracoccus xiamenensis TaxID=2714901 RepID=UPI001408014D|nr:endonuclease/exonuclease/phosphatase family protein [Paracoccus xiamenensis]NHF74145.1 endonuclease [Paracoccus xiamenensis]
MRLFFQLLAVLTLIPLAASYAGRFHPLGDSLAVFRPAMALAMLVLAFAFRRWWRLGVLALGLAAIGPILWMMRPGLSVDPAITVYQKNLLFNRGEATALIEDFRASGAEVILLQELSERNLPIAEAMRDSHRYQILCPAHSVGRVAILSVYPLSDEYCAENAGFTSARVQHPAGAFTAVALHLHWPYPFGQEAQVNRAMADLAGMARPMILGGDFNMVPWAGAPGRIARATDTRIAGPIRPTLFVKAYPLPIDHVLVPAGTDAVLERRPRLGSDHYGVLARIGSLDR